MLDIEYWLVQFTRLEVTLVLQDGFPLMRIPTTLNFSGIVTFGSEERHAGMGTARLAIPVPPRRADGRRAENNAESNSRIIKRVFGIDWREEAERRLDGRISNEGILRHGYPEPDELTRLEVALVKN